MRRLAVVMALAGTALAGPALARDKAWYAGIEGGALLIENIDFDVTSTQGAETNNGVSVNHKMGYDVDGIVGYDFGGFRTEFELGYKKASLDKATLAGVAVPGSGGVATGTFSDAGGTTSALSFMLNGLLDFGDDAGWNGYVGGGVGIARVKADIYQVADQGAAFADDSDTGFAWQVIAGVRKAISDNVDLGLKYRFFNAPSLDIVGVDGAAYDGRFRSHSLLASVIFNFGAEAPPPPPPPVAEPAPPAPPPPPPPPPPPVTPGPFIVFFDFDKSDITTDAADILNRAAQAYKETGQASVTLAGHADAAGPADYNVGLSQRRADAVRKYLAGQGVPETAVTSEAFGETRLLVETADGVREPQNRRVEINFGGASM